MNTQQVNERLQAELGSEFTLTELASRFEAAAALYWYCNDYHSGQSSTEYSILSAQLGYKPGASECGVEDESEAAMIYDMIVCGMIATQDLCDAIKAFGDADEKDY